MQEDPPAGPAPLEGSRFVISLRAKSIGHSREIGNDIGARSQNPGGKGGPVARSSAPLGGEPLCQVAKVCRLAASGSRERPMVFAPAHR
jgi:hypothetical protein